jgi:hypothetical protein
MVTASSVVLCKQRMAAHRHRAERPPHDAFLASPTNFAPNNCCGSCLAYFPRRHPNHGFVLLTRLCLECLMSHTWGRSQLASFRCLRHSSLPKRKTLVGRRSPPPFTAGSTCARCAPPCRVARLLFTAKPKISLRNCPDSCRLPSQNPPQNVAWHLASFRSPIQDIA